MKQHENHHKSKFSNVPNKQNEQKKVEVNRRTPKNAILLIFFVSADNRTQVYTHRQINRSVVFPPDLSLVNYQGEVARGEEFRLMNESTTTTHAREQEWGKSVLL